jgi:hypothetical protein
MKPISSMIANRAARKGIDRQKAYWRWPLCEFDQARVAEIIQAA